MRIGVMLRTIDEKQGIGVYTQRLMDHMLPLDTENEYVLLYKNPEFLGRYSRFPNVKEKLVSAPNKMLWDQVKVPLEARREKLDVIFNTKFTVPFFTRARTVMVLHGSAWFVYPEWYRPLDRHYIRLMMRLYCRKASAIISNSEMTKRDFINMLGVPENKITTTHFGYSSAFRKIEDEVFLNGVRAKYDLPEKFILFVGRIDPGKNFEALVEAFAKIHERIPHKVVVAGHPRWGYEGVFARIEQLGLKGKILFKEWVPQEELVAFYNLADLFVLPSLYEGFGIPLLEAMACGCPAMVSNTGALPEVAGGAAMLVDPLDHDQIAHEMHRILTDDALRRKLSENGLLRAGEFSWQRCARQTLEVLNSLAPERVVKTYA
ncbi:MAG: glycosyltransferase family 4 protein [Chloroflexi bacterium]|nr:glycosyltransferase family 4 protein [Chloroflexota bacterium]